MTLKRKIVASLDGTIDCGGDNNNDSFVVLEKRSKYQPFRVNDDGKELQVDSVMYTPVSEKGSEQAFPQTECEVSIYRPQEDGLVVKVVPPAEPIVNQRRAPVEIVLLIDVSRTMNNFAPVPSGEGEEFKQKGYTRLDLTMHAACTVAESLNEHDTLCIVTFSEVCRILLNRLPMNSQNKELAKKRILSMKPDDLTYLWSGMKLALDQFSGDPDKTAALMVLTDGQPNEPLSNGIIAAMRRWCKSKNLERMPVPIHTFGFGYELEGGLLHSIADFGGGDYCFIPDVSMLGTIFNHAVANLQSTYAQEATITLKFPDILRLRELGNINKAKIEKSLRQKGLTYMEYSVDLRTIQYGQSRDFFFQLEFRDDAYARISKKLRSMPHLHVTLEYRQQQQRKLAFAESNLSIDPTTLLPTEVAFTVSRLMIVEFFYKLFRVNERGEYEPLNRGVPMYNDLQDFVASLPANKFIDDPLNLGLIKDLIGGDNKKGEVELALQTAIDRNNYRSNWEKWGRHYLSSLLMSHKFQKCLSFKDPGTQRYGKGSRLFCDQLDLLDDLFDSLPAPPPSRPENPPPYNAVTGTHTAPTPPPPDMSQYRKVGSNCFAGHTRVLIVNPANGAEKRIPIEKLRSGDIVKTPKGRTKAVQEVLKCFTDQADGRIMTVIPISDDTSLWVTPWHPVSLDGGRTWVRPAEAYPDTQYPEMVKTGFKEPVYAVQLARQCGDDDNDIANEHAINVEGLWGATMGHGLTCEKAAGKADVRIHHFYGNWDAVTESLKKLPKQCY